MHRSWKNYFCFLVSLGIGYGLVVAWDRTHRWDNDSELRSLLKNDAPEASKSLNLQLEDMEDPSKPEESGDDHLAFKELENSGLTFSYRNGNQGDFHLVETLGGGVGVLDFDRDSHEDLIFVDGGDPTNWPDNQQNHLVLYRGNRDLKYLDVSSEADLNWMGYGHGCLVGDVNNDGFDDVFVTGYQSVGLYLNQGDGTFQSVPEVADLMTERWCGSAALGDLDLDGDLDLYVTGYAAVERSLPTPECFSGEQRIHCHPHHYSPVPDGVFENRGDGTFRDRSREAGVGNELQYGLGVVIVDLDQDGFPDIFVANDGDRNLLFRNRGQWKFEEIALSAGVALSGQGRSMGSMGIACADFTQNGYLDLVTTNFSNEMNLLFENRGNMLFTERPFGRKIDNASSPKVGWSAISLDANLDGFQDLFVANGHVTQMPQEPYQQHAILLRGQGKSGWQLSTRAGTYFEQPWHGRGAAKADLNHDLMPDLIVSHISDTPRILLNRSIKEGHGITLKLVGVRSNRNALNTKIRISLDDREVYEDFFRSNGYLSSNSQSMMIGLGEAQEIQELQITWPTGFTQTFRDVAVDASYFLIEEGDLLLDPVH